MADTAEQPRVDAEMITQAVRLSGLDFTETEVGLMVKGVNRDLARYEALRTVTLENSLPPALRFDPLLHRMKDAPVAAGRRPLARSW